MGKQLMGLGNPDPAEIAKGEKNFHGFAEVLDKHLKKREWIVGDHVTLADFSIGSPLAYAQPAHLPIESYGEIQRWYAGLEQLDAWKNPAPAPMPEQ